MFSLEIRAAVAYGAGQDDNSLCGWTHIWSTTSPSLVLPVAGPGNQDVLLGVRDTARSQLPHFIVRASQ